MNDSRDINHYAETEAASAAQRPAIQADSRVAKYSLGRHVIEAVTPSIECGRYPVKRVVGESCVVEADIFRDGHDVIRSAIQWRRKSDTQFAEAPMELFYNDRW